MSISPGYTDDEIRELVCTFEVQPYGTKAQWLKEQAIGYNQMRRWRRAVFDGDLDRGLVPRKDGGMRTPGVDRREKVRTYSADAQRIAELEKQVAELQSSNSKLEATNDALGKAIGLLHELNAHGPDDTPAQSKPSDS